MRFGAITDVDGIRVGQVQRRRGMWRTGTTVVIVPKGATPGVSVRGGAPGTRETDSLAPGNLVDEIHGVCLSGGSAYGLAAADGVAAWLEEQQLGVQVGAPGAEPDPSWVVPVVPGAVIFDLGRGGAFDHRPTAEFGYRAARLASGGNVERGTVGAGMGAVAGGLQGGVGTSSIVVDTDDAVYTVGALAVLNASGSVIDEDTGLPYESGDLRRPAKDERRAVLEAIEEARSPSPMNSTIGIVATSAALTKAECSKFADVAHDGLARAVRPAHSLYDGDTIFGLATGDVELPASDTTYRRNERVATFSQLLDAAARCFALACADAVVEATSLPRGPSAYRDLCPSVVAER